MQCAGSSPRFQHQCLLGVAVCKQGNCSTSAVVCKIGINSASLIDAINYKVLRYYVDEKPVKILQ